MAVCDDDRDKLLRWLAERREVFIQKHPEIPVHRMNFAKLVEGPETATNELISFLGIGPTAEEIDSALKTYVDVKSDLLLLADTKRAKDPMLSISWFDVGRRTC